MLSKWFLGSTKIISTLGSIAESGAEINIENDVITAKCLGVDEKGRVKMSRRAWLRDQKAAEHDAQQPVAAE